MQRLVGAPEYLVQAAVDVLAGKSLHFGNTHHRLAELNVDAAWQLRIFDLILRHSKSC